MSIEATFTKLLEPLVKELTAVKTELTDLKRTQQAGVLGVTKLIYDAEQLQTEFGYSQHEAYAILRTHGAKRGGRRRITFDKLLEYQRGDDNDFLQA